MWGQEDGDGTGIPCTCLGVPLLGALGEGGKGSGSLEPSSLGGLVGTLVGLARRRPSPFLSWPVPGGGWDRRLQGARNRSVEALARVLGGHRPGLSWRWSHLAGAGPARAPEAAGGGVFAEGSACRAGPAWPSRGRPPTWPAGAQGAGLKGSGGGRAGPGAGQLGSWAVGEAPDLGAEGAVSGGSSQSWEKVAGPLPVIFPKKVLSGLSNSGFVGASFPFPTAFFPPSLFR